jgi:hypothetical protein
MAFLGGVLLPFIIVWKSATYHFDDYQGFSAWAECLLNYKNSIYLRCTDVNYPFVGVMASAGVLSAFKTILGVHDYSKLLNYYRFYLAIFDSLNFVLVFCLALALRIKNALIASLLIAALPSSWVGGALWGQIDDVTQFFLLACILCLVTAIQSPTSRLALRSAYCGLGLVTLVALVLTKQLAVFSLPAIVPLLLLAQLKIWTSGTKLHGLIATVSTFLPPMILFWYLDSYFQVPSARFYGSGYLFVWLTSDHANYISNDGFNIWVLVRDMWSYSHTPFYCLRFHHHGLCLTPFRLGLVLYGTYVIALAVLYFLKPLLAGKFPDERQLRFILATIILYLAEINLGFNVFLTGTHERYLYHCFPFLILAGFFFEEASLLSWRSLLFFIAVGTIYGAFVYWVLNPLVPSPLEFVVTIHLILLIYLLGFSFKSFWPFHSKGFSALRHALGPPDRSSSSPDMGFSGR